MPPASAISLIRDFSALSGSSPDLLVVGAGINGAAVAYVAAASGLSVTVVDRADLCGAASSGCFKIVHGGLRYLQHLDFRRVFESANEQKALRVIAPHLVRPLPFLVPCHGYGAKSPEFLGLGARVYDWITYSKNTDVAEELQLAPPRNVRPAQCRELVPSLPTEKMRGGVVFYDAQMTSADRLTLAFLKSAAAYGAQICNYASLVSAIAANDGQQPGRVVSVVVKDEIEGTRCHLTPKVVVNCAGVWVDEVLRSAVSNSEPVSPIYSRRLFSKGIQLVFPSFGEQTAFAVQSHHDDPSTTIRRGSGRSYFIQPWRGCSLVGTADVREDSHPDRGLITTEEVRQFVTELAELYPHPLVTFNNVKHVFGGLRPLEPDSFDRAHDDTPVEQLEVLRHERIVDHADPQAYGLAHGIENFISVIGAKYTTARVVAERVVHKVFEKLESVLKTGSQVADTSALPLVGGDWGGVQQSHAMLDSVLGDLVSRSQQTRLFDLYGSDAAKLAKLIRENPDLALPLAPETTTIGAEVVHAVRHEMAMTLSDVLLRRTEWGSTGYQGVDSAAVAAQLVAQELDWAGEEIDRQLATLKSQFVL